MTLEEKVGQLVQADIDSVTPAEVKKYHLGSVLNGGNSGPHGNDFAAATEWLKLADQFWEASTDKSDGGVGIPVIWGIDAIHGHANIIGATVFPQNIGLGAMHDPELIEKIGAELYRLVDAMARRKLILDFSKVQFLSSSALSVLLELRKKAAAAKAQASSTAHPASTARPPPRYQRRRSRAAHGCQYGPSRTGNSTCSSMTGPLLMRPAASATANHANAGRRVGVRPASALSADSTHTPCSISYMTCSANRKA